ncbi:hypothetical protein [Nocardioides terrigena]|uniref:hypothetical protein n=1 Tax=Nocardioides terrigena TaxID=424797 RepID=UPI000D31EC10|nr:hypothetical protein [Nocardioides terrigena]
MRIRATKPEFWTSKTIAALPWDVRLVLKGLESYVDDNGVGKDDLALIASDVFPRDLVASPRDTLARLSEAITALADGGLIARYEWDGEDLLYIDKWNKLQRIDKPARGRYRRPDGTLEYSEDVNRDTYRSPRETVASPLEMCAPVTGEQGNRGTVSSPSADADAESDLGLDGFEEFWDIYAKKVGRKKAEQKWRLAVKKPDITASVLIRAATNYVNAQQAAGKHPEFTKDPATWLHGEHWTDEAPTNVRQLRTDDQGRTVLPPLPPRSPWGQS